MPTILRINMVGYHHIMNRGVDRMNIFRHSEDKDIFLQIVNKIAIIHKVIVPYLSTQFQKIKKYYQIVA